MTEQLAMGILEARHAARRDYEDELGDMFVGAPWLTKAGKYDGEDWPVASFGQDDEDHWVTMDRVRVSERNASTAKDDAEFVAYMHPIRVMRFVKEIERLRLELWRIRGGTGDNAERDIINGSGA